VLFLVSNIRLPLGTDLFGNLLPESTVPVDNLLPKRSVPNGNLTKLAKKLEK